jgi:hypothetical protein
MRMPHTSDTAWVNGPRVSALGKTVRLYASISRTLSRCYRPQMPLQVTLLEQGFLECPGSGVRSPGSRCSSVPPGSSGKRRSTICSSLPGGLVFFNEAQDLGIRPTDLSQSSMNTLMSLIMMGFTAISHIPVIGKFPPLPTGSFSPREGRQRTSQDPGSPP